MNLEQVWAAVPDVACKGLCVASCGPIDASRTERRLLRTRGVRLKADPMLDVMTGKVSDCPALIDGRCSVYDIRPTVCRLWGAVESMPCEFGCRPERYLTREEGHALLRQAAQCVEEEVA